MPLIDLKTDLKSLKYGHDRLGGGSSGQPYIQTNINRPGTNLIGNFDDGLVRGGAVGAAKASIVDTLRIGKFLTDFPKGPLFIVKQVGLQLSNPRLEAKQLKTDNPTSGGGLLRNVGNFIANIANKITNIVGPTRLYNLGINTIAQVPVNAFGGHFNRHGLLPVQDDQTKYLAVAQFNNEGAGAPDNRLVGLKNRFRLGIVDSSILKNQTFLRRKELKSIMSAGSTSAILLKADEIQAGKIADYIGGPHSVYGIGRTLIKRTPEHTNDNPNLTLAKNRSFNKQHIPEVKIQNTFDFSVSTTTKSLLNKNEYQSPKEKLPTDNTSFLNYVASDSDKHSTNKDHQQRGYSDANNRIKTSLGFVGASTKTSSSFIPNKLPDLTDFGQFDEYKRNTLDENVASDSDKHSTNKDKQAISYTNANNNLRSGSFTSNPTKISGKSVSGLSLNYTTASKNDTKNTLDKWDGALTSSNDLGLSYADVDIISLDINTNQNVIPDISPSTSTSAKYTAIKKQVDATSTISQNFAPFKKDTFAGTFTTIKSAGGGKSNALALAKVYFNRDNDKNINDDTLALIFNPLDPFTGTSLKTLKFLGYITDYTENYDSGWGDVKYAGRAESFYIFNSFKRALTVGFNIPCYNKEELVEKHCALSELASSLAGSYKNDFLLGGIITRLKLGGYIDNQPGIITNLTFNPIQDSSWDLDKGLAFYLKVSFGFTVIHNFLPQFYKDCGFLKDPPPYKEDNTKTIQNTDPVITPTISNIPIFSQTSTIDSTFKRKADQLRNGESLREIFLNDRGLPPDSFIEKIPPPPDSSKLLGKNYYNIPGRG